MHPILPSPTPLADLAPLAVVTALILLGSGPALARLPVAGPDLRTNGVVPRATPTRVCAFNPDLGLPNPLGMRAYVTITEAEGNTTFLFEQFPAIVTHDRLQVEATLALTRQVVFYKTGLEQARQIMLHHPSYYADLVGYADGEGFGPLNGVLACHFNH
ncbi:MAG: hypothetical protein ACOYMP_10225 [Nodosilinea sp.]